MNDKSTGSVTFNGQTGTFNLTKEVAGAAATQAPAGGMSTDEALQKSFANVSAYVIKWAEMVPPTSTPTSRRSQFGRSDS
ncbi:MAG: hypothetical protein M3541_16355 [Acidobacteriota bacterium]|nr:hypothetical protein [Acidobacteriota bacterium]MDQ3420320.1 hypothetical protein [Acidobacteriota bacterium]